MKRMHSAYAVMLGTLIAMGSTSASERYQYKWRDLDGRLHYSDSLPSSAAQHGYEVVNAHGVVIRRVPRARTPEERVQDAAEAARQEAAQDAARRQALADRQMLSAYASEDHMSRAHQEQLAMLDQGIRSAQAGLGSLETSLASRLQHAAELEGADKAVPLRVTEQIDELRKQIRGQRVAIQRRSEERNVTAALFAAELERYRLLSEGRGQGR